MKEIKVMAVVICILAGGGVALISAGLGRITLFYLGLLLLTLGLFLAVRFRGTLAAPPQAEESGRSNASPLLREKRRGSGIGPWWMAEGKKLTQDEAIRLWMMMEGARFNNHLAPMVATGKFAWPEGTAPTQNPHPGEVQEVEDAMENW